MLRTIKNIVLTLLIVISSITVSNAQNNTDITYMSWTQSGAGYWTQSQYYNIYNDFDWAVTRTRYADSYGYYTFKVWFFSQSYYWDGYSAAYTSTNIRSINIYLDGTHWVSDYSKIGITFSNEYVGFKFKSKKSNPRIVITWGTMSAK